MRILLILIAAALLFAACGDDNPYEPDPSPNMAIHIVPSRVLVDLSDSLEFSALNIYNVPIMVVWEVQDIVGGNETYGTIDSDGLYIAPILVPEIDSVMVVATLTDDVSIKDTAWAVIVDPTKVYVDTSGSDSTGTGSRFTPYRTITHALTQAVSTQEVIVRPGIYDLAGNENFPIEIGQGITLLGAGYDSTIIEGPGGRQDRAGAVFAVEQPGIQLKDFCIRTADSNGVGIWIESQFAITSTNIFDNKIISNYYGVYVAGAGNVRPSIEDNIIRRNSIGIYTDDVCQPNIYGNMIDSCFIDGVKISGSSAPNMGQNDSTFAGNNRINDCGPSYNDQYLIYNESPQTIYAIGNIWEYADPDPYIYDDDENPNSGPVLTVNP